MTTEAYIDLSKADHELERMNRGEIPFDPDYLKELVECDDDTLVELNFHTEVTCGLCGGPVVWVECPECHGASHRHGDCFMCEGECGFYDCPKCSQDDEGLRLPD